jgi:hypothetical protein
MAATRRTQSALGTYRASVPRSDSRRVEMLVWTDLCDSPIVNRQLTIVSLGLTGG